MIIVDDIVKSIQGDSDVFSIKQNLNCLQQGEHRFSHAFFTTQKKIRVYI